MTGLATAGMSEVALATTRNCRACDHKMSLHGRTDNASFGPNAKHGAGAAWGALAGPTHSPNPSPQESLAALKQLGELRDAGVVTAAEFEAKKRELLAVTYTAGAGQPGGTRQSGVQQSLTAQQMKEEMEARRAEQQARRATQRAEQEAAIRADPERYRGATRVWGWVALFSPLPAVLCLVTGTYRWPWMFSLLIAVGIPLNWLARRSRYNAAMKSQAEPAADSDAVDASQG